jgi:hypothetical protein
MCSYFCGVFPSCAIASIEPTIPKEAVRFLWIRQSEDFIVQPPKVYSIQVGERRQPQGQRCRSFQSLRSRHANVSVPVQGVPYAHRKLRATRFVLFEPAPGATAQWADYSGSKQGRDRLLSCRGLGRTEHHVPEMRTCSSILESHTVAGLALNWMTPRRHGGLVKWPSYVTAVSFNVTIHCSNLRTHR